MTRYIYYMLHNSDKKMTVTVDDFRTDASMLFIEMDSKNNVKYIALQDATTLTRGDEILFSSDNEIAEFAAQWNYEYGAVDSSVISEELLEENNVVIPRGNVKSLSVNGNDASFNTAGDYIYFGEAPEVDPGATPKPTAAPTKPPVSHGGGSGGSGGSGGGGYTPPSTGVPVPTSTPDPTATEEPSDTEMNEALRSELEDHWAKDEVTYLFEQGIVKGQTETSFGLENPITRAEFVTLLTRAIGLEPAEYTGAFGDVSADDWYAGYIEAAYQAGIFSGSGGMANPQNSITREEMAKLLAGVPELSSAAADIEFTDSAEISGWAAEAVEKVVGAGLMQGRDDGSFDPSAGAKRCEAFVVIYRLITGE